MNPKSAVRSDRVRKTVVKAGGASEPGPASLFLVLVFFFIHKISELILCSSKGIVCGTHSIGVNFDHRLLMCHIC